MLCQKSEMVTTLRAPCDALRESFVEQSCKRIINIFKLLLVLFFPFLPLLSQFTQQKEAPRFHNGVTEVFKMLEYGDKINLSSPVRLFPRASPPEISGLPQISSSVLEHRVEKKECCSGISVIFVLFQPRVGSLQPLKDFFTGWRSS